MDVDEEEESDSQGSWFNTKKLAATLKAHAARVHAAAAEAHAAAMAMVARAKALDTVAKPSWTTALCSTGDVLLFPLTSSHIMPPLKWP